nr:hypothetical protein [Tanacetum cinerariifolium]
MHHLASYLLFILRASCMVSYKDDLYKLLLVHVMATPAIPVSAEENLRDSIDIMMDIIHPDPVPAVAFPAASVEVAMSKYQRSGTNEHETKLLIPGGDEPNDTSGVNESINTYGLGYAIPKDPPIEANDTRRHIPFGHLRR